MVNDLVFFEFKDVLRYVIGLNGVCEVRFICGIDFKVSVLLCDDFGLVVVVIF